MFDASTCKLIVSAAFAWCVLLGCSKTAFAEERSVTIIEGVPEPIQPVPPVAAPAPMLMPLRTQNPAGIHLDILPGAILPVGVDVAFRVSTQTPGYLVLVDINAESKITQIYPNVMSLARKQGKGAVTNLIKPGRTMTVPDLKNPLARFTFRTELPRGKGVIVAILSEQPVQLIDLPELPPSLADLQASVDYLDKSVRTLQVTQADTPGKFDAGTWSLAAVEYVIK
jgi:hypothetical protein